MSSDALGQRVLTGNSVWSSSTGDRIAQLLPAIDRAFPSTLDSRGELAATANFRGQLVVWSATSGRVLHELSSGGAPITSMAFADGDGVLAVADAERRIRLFGVTDGTTLASFESPRVAHALRFSSDGRALIALAPPHLIEFGRDGSELSRHETTAVRLSASSGSAIVAAHSPRAVAGSNRVLEVIGDTSSSSKLVRVLRAMRGVSFSPRQDALLAVDTDGVATLWELTTLDPLLTRHAGGRPSYVELGARNRLLVTTPHQIYLEVLREETRPAEIVTRLADRAR
jgi:WD40 repeat protein